MVLGYSLLWAYVAEHIQLLLVFSTHAFFLSGCAVETREFRGTPSPSKRVFPHPARASSINLVAQIRNTEWSTQAMKRKLVWGVVALLSLMVAAQAKDKEMGGTEQAVAALEQKWIDASKASNPDMLAPLLADKFINTDSSGKVTGKAETLASVKVAKWEKNEI